MKKTAVVLLSGGLDSVTTMHIAKEQGFICSCISFDYGQRHRLETELAKEQAAMLGFSHLLIEIRPEVFQGTALVGTATDVPRMQPPDRDEIPVTYVPARNLLFLSYAVSFAESSQIRDIFIGANALDYSGYPDCRPEFLESFEKTANLGTKTGVSSEKIRIHAPLISMSKAQIVAEAVRLGADLSKTSSCYDPNPDGSPCRECDSCQLRARGFAEAGIADPRLTA